MNYIKNQQKLGTFLAGALSVMALTPAFADQVILDDLIVDGSACIGVDCVNGESFGFDTLRLKENNLRIRFQDTSTSSSFPSSDWQLTANDSNNGGANKFSIDDITSGSTPFTVSGSAPNDSLFIRSNGFVGFGTSVPLVDIHTRTGNTPTLRLEQDGTSGFTAQSWDVAGNESGFFIRDATNGSTLPFRIRPSAPNSSIDIANDGDVGIGTTSPAARLHVQETSSNSTGILVNKNTAAGTGIQIVDATPSGGETTLARFERTAGNAISLNGVTGGRNRAIFESSGGSLVQLRLITNNPNRQISALDNMGGFKTTFTLADSSFQFSGPTASDLWATIDVNGIQTTGAGACMATPCDGVFDPEVFVPESIEAHSEYMWQNQHLKGVGPTPADAPVNLTQKTLGMLHELEKAHIYIEQLNSKIKDMEVKLTELEARSN